jgi:hypothetical protein
MREDRARRATITATAIGGATSTAAVRKLKVAKAAVSPRSGS